MYWSQPRTDVVLGWVELNGRVFVGDYWAVGYQNPKLDEHQDITNSSGKIENGKTILTFSRKRTTKDDAGVTYFLYIFYISKLNYGRRVDYRLVSFS